MKFQNLTKVLAALLLTGVLVGCDQGGGDVTDPVTPAVDTTDDATVTTDETLPEVETDADVDVE